MSTQKILMLDLNHPKTQRYDEAASFGGQDSKGKIVMTGNFI